ncbi:UNVERIFIED_CONTAM: hypothetical protein GTU68_006499 [Idotea baltica]|nr:hypothetical protein [Idotea baltica]
MAELIEIKVPDIGDFDEVEIIEVLVAEGDSVDVNQDIITLESDKAAMEIPSPVAGIIKALKVSLGDKVKQGDVIAVAEAVETVAENTSSTSPASSESAEKPAPAAKATAEPTPAVPPSGVMDVNVPDIGDFDEVEIIEVLVAVGDVVEVNQDIITLESDKAAMEIPTPYAGTVKSVNVALGDKVAEGALIITVDAADAGETTTKSKPETTSTMQVDTADGIKTISFENCIVAAGSRVTKIPVFPHDDDRMMDSTDALDLENVPKKLLVIGGGIIGLEMATVYHALGSKITVVELQDSLIPGADKDIVKPLLNRMKGQYEAVYLNTKVASIKPQVKGLKVSFEGDSAPEAMLFDKVLVAVGRMPNGKLINAEAAGLQVTEQGFINVDSQMRTNVPHIYAIGDIVGQPMLAHKAVHEAKVAAEVISGHKSAFDPMTIPSVAYTDPEVAWMGTSESEAKQQGIDYVKGAFPWAASGRSLSTGRDEGLTKALFDKETGRLIGAGIVGHNAGELIAEAVLALEMGADAEDIGLTIHPHPTLSETLGFAAEMAEGSITDLMPPRKTLHSK